MDLLRGAVEAESDEREDKHDLSRECLRLKLEREEVQTLLDKAMKKIDKLKEKEGEYSRGKEDRAKLEEEVRRAGRERAEQKEAELRVTEEKIRIQAEKVELETRIVGLIKDN